MYRSALAVAICSALALTACGGGGGGSNIKADPPPVAVVATPPKPRYSGVADNVRVPTNLDLAQAQGLDGSGVRIGLMDEARLDYRALDGQVAWYQDVLLDPTSTVKPSDARNGHGTVVAAVIAGLAVDGFNGGGAPGADLYWARICADGACNSEMSRVAAKALAQQGVRIVNLSFAAGGANDAERRQAATWWAYAFAPLLDADALLVASAGNAHESEASYPAATPVYAPQTAGQFLAVAAVEVDANGQPSGLASYSNQCGVAAPWCLVAPGTVQLLDAPETTAVVSGTSIAAPMVTATAALVVQAFPWMSANNLQQTVLSTATDLGTPGVDAVYGWGMVNAAKAVNGPAWFNANFIADVRGNAVFANDIGGSGGLVKRGDGSLVLRGQSRYSGLTEVRAGTLGVQGDLAGSVSVRSGGMLQAMGGRIGGDYSADPGATTAIALGKPLSIGGSAWLDGTLLLQPAANTYVVAASETLLTATQVSGRFSDVALANGFFYTPSLSYAGDRVVASLSRSTITLAAVTANLPAVVVDGAQQTDALVQAIDAQVTTDGTPPSPILASATSLMAADDAQVAASLASFTGQLHGGVRAAAVLTRLQALDALADRLPGLAGGDAPAVWWQVGALDGGLRRSGYARTDYRDDGTTLGLDLPWGDGVLGAALSADRLHVDVGSDRARVDRDGIAFYARQPLGLAYLSAQIAGSRSNVAGNRALQVAATVDEVASRYRDTSLLARLELGLQASDAFMPFIAVGSLRHRQGAFTETSPTAMGLDAAADVADWHYVELGQRAHLQRGRWTLDGVIACRHGAGDTLDFDAAFTGLPAARFIVHGPDLPADLCRADASASVTLGERLWLRGSIGAQRGSGQAEQHHADLALTWRF